MSVRGIRGATTVEENEQKAILAATRELITAILQANPTLRKEEIASVLFTVTDDLNAAYPALAARQLGWQDVPLMCGREIPVPEGLPRCIRILLHWNTDLPQHQIHHIYLREATRLRPEWAREPLQSKGAAS